jgi:hypothetical protein
MNTQTEVATNLVPAMVLEPGAWTSLYLKVLPVDLTINGNDINDEAALVELIECGLQLGKVERIDFSHRKTNNGAILKSAYIHFFLWNAVSGAYCRNEIDNHGSVSYAGITDMYGGMVHPFMGKWYNGVSKNRFLTFKKNNNPISSTNINDVNQEQLAKRCEQLAEQNERLHNTVQQFIHNERSELLTAAMYWKALAEQMTTAAPVTDDEMSISELRLDSDDDDDEPQYVNRNLGDEMEIEEGEVE